MQALGPPTTPPLRRGFAVVDVETTGLDPSRNRIIELAVALVSADGRLERRWTSLVRPRGSTGPVHIHGITRAHLVGAPRFSDIADELSELLAGRILVAHNAQFDWNFLAYEAARAGTELPVRERLCTVTLARQLNIPAQNLKLATLAQHWDIPVDARHRAEADVTTLIEVLGRCLDEAGKQLAPLPLERCHPAPPRPRRLAAKVLRGLCRIRFNNVR